MRIRRLSLLLLLLLAGLVLVPSANSAVFSGLPLDSPYSFAAGLVFVLVAVSPSVRRRWKEWWAAQHLVRTRAAVAVAALALAAKVMLLTAGVHTGFPACYNALPSTRAARSGVVSVTAGGGCEHSYANPLSRFGVTRLDETIDFGALSSPESATLDQTNWDLDFFNSSRFNFYRGSSGEPDRDTLPFSVRWRGVIANAGSDSERLVARYVGEGIVLIDDQRITLPASYGVAATRALAVPPGRHHIVVGYRFGQLTIQPETLAGPYAEMSIRHSDGTALHSAAPGVQWRAMILFADGVTTALLLVAAWALLLVVRGAALLAIVLAGITAVAIRLPHDLGTFVIGGCEIALFALALWAVLRRHRTMDTALVAVCVCLIAIEFARAQHDFVSFGQVIYRGAGDDFLTYESQAHAVLAGSLRGGESVFVYSPAFRYMLALGHLLFGNGDARLSLVILVALSLVVVAFGIACLFGRSESPPRRVWDWSGDRRRSLLHVGALGAVVLSLLLAGHPAIASMVRAPLSEFPTWVLIPTVLLLAVHVRSRGAYLLAATLAGVALTTRFEKGIGLFLLLVCGATALWQRERDRRVWSAAVAGAVAIFGMFAVLPGVHNLHYGNEFTLIPPQSHITGNVPLPPSQAIRVCCDQKARATFFSQLRGVTAVGAGGSIQFVVGVRMLQLLWLASLVALWINRRSADATTRLVAVLPLAFLLPHLFVQVFVYYPRHIVAGYLMMGLTTAFVLSELARYRPVPALGVPSGPERRKVKEDAQGERARTGH